MEADKEGIYEKVLMTQHIMTRFMEVPNKNGNADGNFYWSISFTWDDAQVFFLFWKKKLCLIVVAERLIYNFEL